MKIKGCYIFADLLEEASDALDVSVDELKVLPITQLEDLATRYIAKIMEIVGDSDDSVAVALGYVFGGWAEDYGIEKGPNHEIEE